jgi:dipeptidyl aminopeptidase/acylaminoacyl peptidase
MNHSNHSSPFREVEVSFINEESGVTLWGTLSLPQEDGKLPAVVLFPGSGAVDRDSTFGKYKAFKIIAEYLAGKGIAVLRFDKRGVGKSTGEFATLTEEDLVQDGCVAIEYLKSRSEINPKHIGLIGHSEGGLIASMLASRSDDVKFLVIMAGPILSGKENSSLVFTLLVNEDKAKTQNLDEDKVVFDRFFTLVSQQTLSQTQREECIEIAKKMLPRITNKTKAVLGFTQLTPETFVSIFSIPWLQELLDSFPESTIRKLKCPILGIYGSKDVQVPPQNGEVLNTILEQSGHADYTVKEIVNANHLFQYCITGYPSEYPTNSQTMVPEVLAFLDGWISEK